MEVRIKRDYFEVWRERQRKLLLCWFSVLPFWKSRKFSGDLLHRLKIDGGTDDYIEQLIPTTSPISKIKIKFFGHSGVGKTCIIDSLKAGYFSSLFRRGSKRNSSFSGMIFLWHPTHNFPFKFVKHFLILFFYYFTRQINICRRAQNTHLRAHQTT